MAKFGLPGGGRRSKQPQSPARLSTKDGFHYASIAGDKYREGGALSGISDGKLVNAHGRSGELILGSAQTNNLSISVGTSWTILLDFSLVSQTNLYPYILGISGAANAFALAPRHDTFAGRATWYDGTSIQDSGLTLSLGGLYVIGLTYNADTNVYSWFKDGVAGNSYSGVNTGSGTWQFASATGEGSTSNINLLAFSNQCVSAQRMLALTANPWQIFGPRKQELYVNVAAGGSPYTMTAASGSFALTGNTAGLQAGRKMVAASATYTLTGNASALTVARKLAAATGSFTLTGNAAGLQAARKLVAASGTFTLTGNAATLTYTPSGYTYTMSAAAGTFTLTGNATALQVARKMTAGTGGFTLTGNDVTFTHRSSAWTDVSAATGVWTDKPLSGGTWTTL